MRYIRFAALAFPPLLVGFGLFAGLHYTARPEPGAASSAAPRAPEVVDTAAIRRGFETIYQSAEWGTSGEGLGTSGTGSTLGATLIYRTFLQQFLADHDIHSVVDAGCGDWEFSQAIDWTGIDYKGFDIVGEVIERDRARYAKPNIQFFAANMLETDLPPADLLISKHVLQHLPTSGVQTFLRQLPKYKHVLIVNGVDQRTMTANNTEIPIGGYRHLDVTRPPFNLAGAKVLTYVANGHAHQVVHLVNPRP